MAKKTKVGIVVSNKMPKTVVVKTIRSFIHPFYKKVIKRSKHFKVHDEDNKCAAGDKVLIIETRPLSKNKRWKVVEIISKGKVEAAEEKHDSSRE